MTAIAMCMIVLAAAQPTPYMTSGYIRKGDATHAINNPVVTVINLNTTTEWTAETNISYNYYQLVLKNSSEVKEGVRVSEGEGVGRGVGAGSGWFFTISSIARSTKQRKR